VDGRETAPAAAIPGRFDGLTFPEAWQSGLSVGVPGTVKALEYLHAKYGKLVWKTLFDDAIALARGGFHLTDRTSSLVDSLLSFNDILGYNC